MTLRLRRRARVISRAHARFGPVLVAVHEVALFPELQRLPDDDDLAARRAFARHKLDILKLAVDRFARPGSRTPIGRLQVSLRPLSDDALVSLWGAS